MTGIPCGSKIVEPIDVTQRPELLELVRGSDQTLLDWVAPLARRQCVALDLGRVRRIDAAGIAALILLYRVACEAGNHFCIVNASQRVTEILALVGLDHILISQDVNLTPHTELAAERSAA